MPCPFVVYGPPLMSTFEGGWHQQTDINEPHTFQSWKYPLNDSLRDPLLARESAQYGLHFGLFVLTYLLFPVIWFCSVNTFWPNLLQWQNTWVDSVDISIQEVSLCFYLKLLNFQFSKIILFNPVYHQPYCSCNGVAVELQLVFADSNITQCKNWSLSIEGQIPCPSDRVINISSH